MRRRLFRFTTIMKTQMKISAPPTPTISATVRTDEVAGGVVNKLSSSGSCGGSGGGNNAGEEGGGQSGGVGG